MEALKAKVINADYDCVGSIEYEAYMQGQGWQNSIKKDNAEAGIPGGG